MPWSKRKLPVWLPILILLVAMSSIQSGASLAKSLFPLVGAPGVTALRPALGTLILIAFLSHGDCVSRRTTAATSLLWLVTGGNELSVLSRHSDSASGYCRSA